jgi:hypothetical protein
MGRARLAQQRRRALAEAKKAGHAYMVFDGTLIRVNRVAADRPFYSSKHRRHGMNLEVISAPDGEILRVSGRLAGAVHDLTSAVMVAGACRARSTWRRRRSAPTTAGCGGPAAPGGRLAARTGARHAEVHAALACGLTITEISHPH